MITGYKELKAGDIRKERDEIRRTHPYAGCRWDKDEYDFRDLSNWQTIETLIGESILLSDLIVAEFRRPLL